MILTSRQVREGREIAGLTQADLATAATAATAAGVAVSLLARIEAVDGMIIAKKSDWMAIQRALEAAGVEFIPENSGGAGVRLRKVTP